MSYGITLNCSLIQPKNESGYQMGVSIKNSDGIDIDYSIEGDDIDTMLEEAIYDIFEDYAVQTQKLEQAKKAKEEKVKKAEEKQEAEDEYILQLHKIIEDLTQENNSLKTDLDILQKRADDAVNKNMEHLNQKEHFDDVEKKINHIFDNDIFKRFFD